MTVSVILRNFEAFDRWEYFYFEKSTMFYDFTSGHFELMNIYGLMIMINSSYFKSFSTFPLLGHLRNALPAFFISDCAKTEALGSYGFSG